MSVNTAVDKFFSGTRIVYCTAITVSFTKFKGMKKKCILKDDRLVVTN